MTTTTTSRQFQQWPATYYLVAIAASWLLFSCHPCAGKEGLATFYTPPYTPSACYGFRKQHGMIAAANENELWQGGSACGKYYRVTCLKGTNKGVDEPCKQGRSVTVKIVDLCPAPGCRGTIDLSRAAFREIADPAEGKIVISYERVYE